MTPRQINPHHSTTTDDSGRTWIYTHSIGEYLADERKPYSKQQFIYVPTLQDCANYAKQGEEECDRRNTLRMSE